MQLEPLHQKKRERSKTFVFLLKKQHMILCNVNNLNFAPNF